ncbi:alpha-E domain-containing protein [Parafilimonas sp.]|uniref:alpha-E domain-containing protein n=1 Tax=Parafilimonas sp. TaxID=1969739 RepID=UPI0039E6B9F4
MLSRLADSLFWLNRYMERADGLLRAMRTNYILSLDKGINSDLTWRPLLEIFTTLPEEDVARLENDTNATLHYLLTDTANLNSLKAILTKARENARGVQDHITKEVWEQVNQMYHSVNHPDVAADFSGYDALETIENFSQNSLLLMGITDATMPRGAGWSFMNLGKYIERCSQTNELTNWQYRSIQYDLENPIDIVQWQFLLFSLSGFELHLKTYQSADHNKNVLHQVLLNEDFTRSALYSLNRISRYLEDVLSENRSVKSDDLTRYFGRMFCAIKYINLEELNGEELQACLQHLRSNMQNFNRQLTACFFSYT